MQRVNRRWTKKGLVDVLIDLYDSGVGLISGEIENTDSSLHSAIYYKDSQGKHKYFSSLREVRELIARKFEQEGRLKDAKKVRKLNNPSRKTHKDYQKKRKNRRKKQLEKIRIVDKNSLKTLKSQGWVSSRELAERLNVTQNNISRNVLVKYPRSVVRYYEGKRCRYLFHRSIIKGFSKRDVVKSPKNSMNSVANEFEVHYSRIRGICKLLDLGTRKRSHVELSEEDRKKIWTVLEREKIIVQRITGFIDPNSEYTFRELEIMGVPISYFLRGIRSGSLEPGKRGKTTTIKGDNILDYFKNNYNPKGLSRGIRLLTHFHPNLHTISELIPILKLNRTNVVKRVSKLKEENPDCCFKIRKSQKRSDIIVTDETLPFLKNWGVRHGLQLISMTDKLFRGRKTLSKDVEKAIRDSEKVVGEGLIVKKRDQKDAFIIMNILDDFAKGVVDIGGVSVTNEDLSFLYRYMKLGGYKEVEIAKSYSLEELARIVHHRGLLSVLEEARQNLGFALYNSNQGLINYTIREFLRRDPSFLGESDSRSLVFFGQEALMNAVDKYRADNEWGANFASYALTAIKRKLVRQNILSSRKKSLDEEIGDGDTKMWQLMEDPNSEDPEVKAMELDLKEKVNSLLDTLSERDRKVLVFRFYKRKTQEEVGKEFGLTKQRISQIEIEALKKLAEKKEAKVLREYLE